MNRKELWRQIEPLFTAAFEKEANRKPTEVDDYDLDIIFDGVTEQTDLKHLAKEKGCICGLRAKFRDGAKEPKWEKFTATVQELIDYELHCGRPSPEFFRDLVDANTGKGVGYQVLTPEDIQREASANRFVGIYGQKRIKMNVPFETHRGHKMVVNKPTDCMEIIYPLGT